MQDQGDPALPGAGADDREDFAEDAIWGDDDDEPATAGEMFVDRSGAQPQWLITFDAGTDDTDSDDARVDETNG